MDNKKLSRRHKNPSWFPSKKLGQNFLRSKSVLSFIVNSAKIRPGELILEIGSGGGALTRDIIAKGGKVVAVEKDPVLAAGLKRQFAKECKSRQLKIVTGDIRDLKPRELVGRGPYKLVANIPYYLTGTIFRNFLTQTPRPTYILLMVQKEVGERVTRSKKESLLSISVKAYGNPRYLKTVPAGAFWPIPKVDSAIISIDDITDLEFRRAKVSEKKFFQTMRRGFAHKRKKLSKNIGVTDSWLHNLGLPKQARAEDLSLSDWFRLSAALNEKNDS